MDNTITTPPEATGGKQKIIMVALITIIIFAIVGLAMYVNFMQQGAVPLGDTMPPATVSPAVGADIYNEAQNPVKDQIPEAAAPVTNPIGDAYQNPF